MAPGPPDEDMHQTWCQHLELKLSNWAQHRNKRLNTLLECSLYRQTQIVASRAPGFKLTRKCTVETLIPVWFVCVSQLISRAQGNNEFAFNLFIEVINLC